MTVQPLGQRTRSAEHQKVGVSTASRNLRSALGTRRSSPGPQLDLAAASLRVVAAVRGQHGRRFAPGTRTAWHSHVNGQTLHITDGVAWVQARGGPIIELHPGETIYTPPGEEHWHGASLDRFMEHLAMLENGDDPATSTTWLEHVTDEEYQAPR